VADCYEQDNELSGFLNGGKSLDQLSDYQLLNKDSVLWSWLSHTSMRSARLALLCPCVGQLQRAALDRVVTKQTV
jgi:hypothetical protein